MDNRKKTKTALIIYFLIILSIGILFIIFKLSEFNKLCHELYKKEVASEYKGIIIKKFIDEKNHSFKTVHINTGNKIKITIWDIEYKGFYEFVTTGDSIVKKGNTDIINVYRDNRLSKSFKADFNCDEE